MTSHDETLDALRRIVGPGNVLTGADDRAFFSRDLFFQDRDAVAVVQPATRAELGAVVRAAVAGDLAVVARGGGLSYTKGYVPAEDGIVIDTRRLNRIIDFAPDNLTITAEAGCTWEQIYNLTAPAGLRAIHFGPTTGRYSTLGGGLSNNSMFFGSAKHGTAADAVLGMEVVLADGTLLTTGSGAIKGGAPFFRNHGPDLTGLFLNDAGALGIKAAVTLRLERIPVGLAVASWSFQGYDDMIAAAIAVGRAGLASECLGVGAYPVPEDVPGGQPTLHVTTEGWTQSIADIQASALQELVGQAATAIDPVVPRFIRSDPFGFIAIPLHADGRRQIWTHGIFPFDRVAEAYRDLTALIDRHRVPRATYGIETTISVAISGTAALLEPVLTWPDQPTALHLRGMAAPNAASLPPVPEATAAVGALRQDMCDLYSRLGAAHLQLGKFYAFAETMAPQTLSLLQAVKAAVDPHRRLNPRALGL